MITLQDILNELDAEELVGRLKPGQTVVTFPVWRTSSPTVAPVLDVDAVVIPLRVA